MPVEGSEYKSSYACNGSTTTFPITFPVITDVDDNAVGIAVLIRDSDGEETVLTETTHYSISGLNVETVATYTSGNTLVIYPDNEFTQENDWKNGGEFDMRVLTKAFDKLTLIVRQLREIFQRNLYVPISDADASLELPSVADRANKLLGFDADGDAIAYAAATTAGVTAFMLTLLDDESAAAALSTLGISSFIQTLLEDANAAAARSTLEITLANLGISAFAQTILDDADAGAAQTTLGISSFVKTLLDNSNTTAFLTTLGITSFIQTLMDDATAEAARATLGLDTTDTVEFGDTTTGDLTADSLSTDNVALRTKVIEIGDWNMDTGGSGIGSVSISHGLTLSDIRRVTVVIRNDADTIRYMAGAIPNPDTNNPIGFDIRASTIEIQKSNFFTGTAFDSTSYNRGWILIDYIGL